LRDPKKVDLVSCRSIQRWAGRGVPAVKISVQKQEAIESFLRDIIPLLTEDYVRFRDISQQSWELLVMLN
jgi:hypothetical protein